MTEDVESDAPQWGPWQRQLQATHVDLSCDRCAYPGPLLECFGSSEVPEQVGRRVVQPSRVADRQRLRSVPYPIPAHMVRTHYAVRCPACGDQTVYAMRAFAPWEERGADEVAGPVPPRPSSCCEHECGAGPHP